MNVSVIISRVTKFFIFVLFALCFIGAGQFSQLVMSSEDLKMNVVADWRSKNPESGELVDSFFSSCVYGLNGPVVSIYQCGDDVGADGLMEELRRMNLGLISVSWPLSIVYPEHINKEKEAFSLAAKFLSKLKRSDIQ
ncbi:MAG: hypothetical protein ACRBCS_16005 [Cellvibrionaceae bacterium]